LGFANARARTSVKVMSVISPPLVAPDRHAGAVDDLVRRPPTQVRGPKWAWAPAMAVNFVGPLAYLRWGRIRPSVAPGSDS